MFLLTASKDKFADFGSLIRHHYQTLDAFMDADIADEKESQLPKDRRTLIGRALR
jgi:hypothetical protein